MPASTTFEETTAARYQTLLEVSESIGSHQSMSQLIGHLGSFLKRVVRFDGITTPLYDPERRIIPLLAVNIARESPVPGGRILLVKQPPAEIVLANGQPHYVP